MKINKKGGNSKPSLHIAIQDCSHDQQELKQELPKNQVATKPLRSAKNGHEMKKFSFAGQEPQHPNSGRQMRRLKKLQEERVNLMHSLQILKVSAVSAIAEKQGQIENMKQRELPEDQHAQFYQTELERAKRLRMDLEEEREELSRQLFLQRQRYTAELEDKQYVIEQLCEEIRQIRRDFDIVEENSIAKSKKIKLLQEQNGILSDQLERSSLVTASRERYDEILELQSTIKAQSAISGENSHRNRVNSQFFQNQHLFQSEADKSFVFDKLESVQKMHKDQLLDLKVFYEKRIAALREIYERQLHLQTQQSDRVLDRSRRNSQSSTPSLQKNQSKKDLNLHLNLNLNSIEQSVQNELQTSRTKMMNLQRQIRMQNLSECPSIQPRMYTNQDSQSQFTTKYFDVPTRFMLKRNKSTETFAATNDPQMKKIANLTIRQEQTKQELDQTQGEKTIFKKPFIFAAGLISGVTITSIIGYLIKRND